MSRCLDYFRVTFLVLLKVLDNCKFVKLSIVLYIFLKQVPLCVKFLSLYSETGLPLIALRAFFHHLNIH